MNFSVSEENYLKGIYHLQQETDTVTTNSLANELQTRPASVTDMLKKLQIKKLLEYEKYKGHKYCVQQTVFNTDIGFFKDHLHVGGNIVGSAKLLQYRQPKANE